MPILGYSSKDVRFNERSQHVSLGVRHGSTRFSALDEPLKAER
jgi:hypothetical protein